MKIHIDDVEVENNGVMEKKKQATVHTYDETGETQVKQMLLSGELDITVQAGSDLPFETADKERKALALFDRQIIDAEEVLTQLQYPNKEKLLMRLNARQQAAAAQQQTAPQGA